MKYKEKKYTDVAEVNSSGIVFISGEKLVFSECVGENNTCVGERDIDAEPPYFEFYTSDKPTRIVFDRKGLLSDTVNQREFVKMQCLIADAGFSTLDLS
ncbi:hypothetical protein [Ruminococcus albus]|uniref:Uncharacterized protein n=1 Tax=Ruminococcus albus 8 TaxID=246199 RepID=E9SC15_RUMAL|nr:hypothetical protein [Ruminococcus albus]EGC03215.1 hypothetical protein CUS_6832 [Ruminococcus albus 8]MCC3351973.1 hypothetical protein [Ruminococcus albus 8]